MLHVFQLVIDQFSFDSSQLVNVLLSVVSVCVLGLLLLESHLGLEFTSHLLALASESHHLLALLGGPVVVVSVNGRGPLSLGHADNFALEADADLVVGVNHH